MLFLFRGSIFSIQCRNCCQGCLFSFSAIPSSFLKLFPFSTHFNFPYLIHVSRQISLVEINTPHLNLPRPRRTKQIESKPKRSHRNQTSLNRFLRLYRCEETGCRASKLRPRVCCLCRGKDFDVARIYFPSAPIILQL